MFVIVGSLWPALTVAILGETVRQGIRRGVKNSGAGKDLQRKAGALAMAWPREPPYQKIKLECFDGDEVLVTIAEKAYLERLDQLEDWSRKETINLLSVIWHEQEKRRKS
jgi:hypothetical protein